MYCPTLLPFLVLYCDVWGYFSNWNANSSSDRSGLLAIALILRTGTPAVYFCLRYDEGWYNHNVVLNLSIAKSYPIWTLVCLFGDKFFSILACLILRWTDFDVRGVLYSEFTYLFFVKLILWNMSGLTVMFWLLLVLFLGLVSGFYS